jgi:hypothetical protein
MFWAFILLLLTTAGGFAVTYFYDKDAPFWVRVFVGAVIGQVVWTLLAFVIACFVGMSVGVAVWSAIMTAAPFIFSRSKFDRAKADFERSFEAIKNFAARPTIEQIVWTAAYFGLFVLLWFFFERAMFNVAGAIATGNIHNTGDISFHLQAIYSFLDGQNFPPQNPSFEGAKFTYPFMVDLGTALLAAVGARIGEAKFWQNLLLITALAVVMRHFTFKLTDNSFAANLAPFLLFLSGGLGFIFFFNDGLKDEHGIFGALMQMPNNYTIRDKGDWRWGNTLTVLFMTQRSFLLGMPLALVVLTKVWEIFANSETKIKNSKLKKNNFEFLTSNFEFLLTGLLAGALPLVHAHSFAVVMAMTACIALISLERWRQWLVFFAASSLIAAVELVWATRNSASKMANFIAFQPGWDNAETNFFLYWFKNTGFFIPLLLTAIAVLLIQGFKAETRDGEDAEAKTKIENRKAKIVLFWLPFVLCFAAPNVLRLAPWIWDNIKILIYWFVASIPPVAWLIAQIWRRGGAAGKFAAASLIVVLTLAGFLDVWRVASGQMEYITFNKDTVELARKARQILPPRAVVMSAPMHDSAAAIMGRRWFLGFTGHVWSHGIDPSERESIIRRIYFGDADADKLLKENNIEYVLLTPQEYDYTVVNENFMRRFPVVAQVGEYRLLQVKQNGEK